MIILRPDDGDRPWGRGLAFYAWNGRDAWTRATFSQLMFRSVLARLSFSLAQRPRRTVPLATTIAAMPTSVRRTTTETSPTTIGPLRSTPGCAPFHPDCCALDVVHVQVDCGGRGR